MADIDRSRLRRFGVALVCVKVALVPLVFEPSFDLPFVVPKALVSHALAYLLAGVLAALAIRFGRVAFVWSWLHVPVLAFLAVNVLAATFAVDPLLALYGTHARMLGLGMVADWVAFYFAIVLLVRTRVDWFAVGSSLVGASVIVLVYEAMQLAHVDPFRWNVDVADRPFSTIGQPTSLGQYLTTLALGVASLALLVAGVVPRVRVALLLYAFVLLVGTALNGTRSALFGVAAGSLLLLVVGMITQRSRRVVAISVATAALAAGAVGLIFAPSLIGLRLAATVEALQAADSGDDLIERLEPWGSDRSALYRIAADVVRERPLLGYGPDGFAAGVPPHRPEGAHPTIQQGIPTSGHSWLSYVVTSSGLLGLVAFLSIVAVAFWLTFRRGLRMPAVVGAAMIASFLGTGLTTINEISTEWLIWFALGTIAVSTASPRAVINDAGRRRVRSSARRGGLLTGRSVAAAACLGAGVLMLLTLGGPAAASRSAKSSADARLLGRSAPAIEMAIAATRSDGSRAQYWEVLGLAEVSAARWPDAIIAFERAVALAPYDVRYLGDAATASAVLARSGDAAARARAIQLVDQGVATDPNNPGAHTTRGLVLQLVGEPVEALKACERALQLDPRSINPRLYVAMAQLLSSLGRPGDAAAIARRGIAVFSVTPLSFDVRIELVRALLVLGRPTDALAEIDIALGVRPNDPTALRLRAEAQASAAR